MLAGLPLTSALLLCDGERGSRDAEPCLSWLGGPSRIPVLGAGAQGLTHAWAAGSGAGVGGGQEPAQTGLLCLAGLAHVLQCSAALPAITPWPVERGTRWGQPCMGVSE